MVGRGPPRWRTYRRTRARALPECVIHEVRLLPGGLVGAVEVVDALRHVASGRESAAPKAKGLLVVHAAAQLGKRAGGGHGRQGKR